MCKKHIVIDKKLIKNFLPKRPNNTHKYNFGHVLVIAGSINYPGAAILAAESAMSVGSGIVTLAIPQKIYEVTASRLSKEIIMLPLGNNKSCFIEEKSINTIINYIKEKKVNTICLGCGISKQKNTKIFVNKLVSTLSKKYYEIDLILDADGFSLLEIENKKIKILNDKKHNIILTPHTGEYIKLIGEKPNEDLCYEVYEFAKKNNLVLTLKSSFVIISDGNYIFKFNNPNSALSKAGSGDVLAGIIAGLIYQIKNYNLKFQNYNHLIKTAVLSVYLHSQSATIGKNKKTEFCFQPTDIIKFLPETFKQINKK